MGVLFPGRSSGNRAPHLVSILTTPPVLEPLTLAEGKLRAGLDWPAGDPRDALMLGFIASARAKLEQDTGIFLFTQGHTVLVDWLPAGQPFALPGRPVQSVTVSSIDTAGVTQPLVANDWILDPGSVAPQQARLAITPEMWPTDLRAFQPWLLELVVGFETVAALRAAAPALIDAVGLLVAHAATIGRDRFTEKDLRDEYEDTIAPYKLVVVP